MVGLALPVGLYVVAMLGSLRVAMNAKNANEKIESSRWRRRRDVAAVLSVLVMAAAVTSMQLYQAAQAGHALRHDQSVTQSDVDRLAGTSGAWISVVQHIVYWQDGQRVERDGPLFVVPDYSHHLVYALDPRTDQPFAVSSDGYGHR